MKETDRIAKLFSDLYSGNPWIDVSITGTLKNISAETAGKKIAPDLNSIWEIVNHIIGWRQNILERVHGEIVTSPEENYFKPVPNKSEEAWQQTLQQLEETQHQWVNFLQQYNDEELAAYSSSSNTNYYYIHGIIQHDAYHLGQIVLLAKMA